MILENANWPAACTCAKSWDGEKGGVAGFSLCTGASSTLYLYFNITSQIPSSTLVAGGGRGNFAPEFFLGATPNQLHHKMLQKKIHNVNC